MNAGENRPLNCLIFSPLADFVTKMTGPLLLQQMVISKVEIFFYLIGYLSTISTMFYAAYQSTRKDGRWMKMCHLKGRCYFFSVFILVSKLDLGLEWPRCDELVIEYFHT